MLSKIFQRFMDKSPVPVMVQVLLERVLSPDKLNSLFERTSVEQYTRTLLFSTLRIKMTKKMQEYTEEFKQGAVNMVLKEGLSRSDVGRRLDTSCKNVSRWVKEHQTNKPCAQSNIPVAIEI